jgi:hypothetical protein
MNESESYDYYNLSALEAGLRYNKVTLNNSHDDTQLLKRIQQFYLSIKSCQKQQPEIYQPAGEWSEHLKQRMQCYQAFYENTTDKLGQLLSNFWRNELGVLVKQYAGFQQLQECPKLREDYTKLMAHDLMIWSNLFNLDVSVLKIPEVGNPWGYLWSGTLIGSKNLRYHALATQVQGLVEDIKQPVVAEIGAGYCGMAYYLMRGGDNRKYINFDLPETLVVGAYYLSKSLPHRKIYLHNGGEIDWQKILRDFDIILLPNWMLQALPNSSVDVFINTFSLSEMSYPVIKHYLERITASCRYYFLHNNMDRKGVVEAGFERVPASEYPFPPNSFKCLYKRYDLFQQKHSGRNGDYREFLYQRTFL